MLFPDCPEHPGHYVHATVVNGCRWVYCAGTGWHADPAKVIVR